MLYETSTQNGGIGEHMQRILRGLIRPSTFLPIFGMVLLGFGVSSQLIAQNVLAILINGLFIAMTVVVAAAYGVPLVNALKSEEIKKDQYLLTGIVMLWVSIAASRIWSLAIITAGKPDWMINHWFQSFCYLAAAASGFYFLQLVGHPRRGLKYATAAIALAVVIVTFTMAFS
jgi:hypothetical protein